MKPVCHFLLLRRRNKALQHARVRAAELGSYGSLSPIILISQFIAITSHQSHPPSAAAAATGDSSIAQPSVSCTQHTQYGVAVAAVLKQSVIRRRCRRPPLNPICTSLVRIISLLTAASAAFASLSRTKHRLTITTLDSGHVILLLLLSTLHFSITRNIQMKR